ncbi:TonB-dependent siderophore receptor [Altererythrobacter sp. KTW20L]|uniref:TonB-dependent siderophore receptor n=1 Tax=Altererythrobacter sp. KTW20L TaxID=2942210 RepID=UPI0020C0704B|nr:TonB-dependent siderophore receptor [Altererythrobacter sp. KTW20L]MCL6252226.1 TonB-dependent siderophore receptor [Altererythrobacter sp. KTW20L]
MSFARSALLACTALAILPATALAAEAEDQQRDAESRIVVTGARATSASATKTDTPAIEVPQPVTVIPAKLFEAQGAVSISDTLNYVAGVQSNPYGPDSRVDGGFVRGINALQFRDGMRDIFSFYASIRADPYNFSQVEVLRGPSSTLFGAGSIGGLINLVSKTPEFTTGGEVAITYGSFDRKEVLIDVTGPVSETLALRLATRLRDSGTQTDFVPDDRVMIAPSLTWQPSMDTSLTLMGLYQKDNNGSTSQFLPLVGTILPNPNGQLPADLFIGKPGWDRYDGRLAQVGAVFDQRLADSVTFSTRARYIDSDLDYFTHYPNSYGNPANPYLDADQRLIQNYASGSIARMEVFSTDSNLAFTFNTGANVEHTLLAGMDYSWNRVRKTDGYALEVIDIYDIDYDALSDFNGTIPMPGDPGFAFGGGTDTAQKQLGFYLQNQIRFFDRVSLVLGLRHDDASATSFGAQSYSSDAMSYKAGLIAEVFEGVSPFVSYTESFEPIAGTASNGQPFVPKRGEQWEAGVKIHPTDATILTLTAYRIRETNRPISDDSTPDPFDQIQAGELVSKGFEASATAQLPGDVSLIANYSYNEAEVTGTDRQLDNVPKTNASVWATKPFQLSEGVSLLVGGGVRHSGRSRSFGAAFPLGLVTPSYTLVDALAEVSWDQFSFRLNATNLLGKDYYSACLARGDCFQGAERNVMGTLSYNF